MLGRIRHALQGSLALLVVFVNTVLLTTTILILSIFKFVTPKGPARNSITRLLSWIAELWISINKFVIWFYRGMKWDIQVPDELNHNGRYLVFCNHQSWVDILVLQHCLNRKAPFMRFLLKQQLIWVPFLGFAWWALDMAFLRRYSTQELLRNPALRGKDLENAARACEKLKHIPVSMMTFPEGTRFTHAKWEEQKSPYKHLLKPRYGGIGQVLYSFDEALDKLIDVTIVYPDGIPTTWQYFSGQVRKITINVRLRPIGDDLRGKDFRGESNAKASLRAWLAEIWEVKDKEIDSILGSAGVTIHPDMQN